MAMPKRSKANINKRLSKLERKEAEDRPETKYRTYDINLKTTTTFKADLFPLIQGTGIGQRVGNSVRFMHIEVRYRFRNDSTTYSPIVRSLLILDTANRQAATPFADADLFSSTSSLAYTTLSGFQIGQVGRGRRFRVLKDLTQNITMSGDGQGTTRTLIFKIPLNMRVSFITNVDSTTALPNRSLIFAMYNDGPTGIDIRGTMTITYQDA
jgi:hypothetical protein